MISTPTPTRKWLLKAATSIAAAREVVRIDKVVGETKQYFVPRNRWRIGFKPAGKTTIPPARTPAPKGWAATIRVVTAMPLARTADKKCLFFIWAERVPVR
jgi:hypothetical protein